MRIQPATRTAPTKSSLSGQAHHPCPWLRFQGQRAGGGHPLASQIHPPEAIPASIVIDWSYSDEDVPTWLLTPDRSISQKKREFLTGDVVLLQMPAKWSSQNPKDWRFQNVSVQSTPVAPEAGTTPLEKELYWLGIEFTNTAADTRVNLASIQTRSQPCAGNERVDHSHTRIARCEYRRAISIFRVQQLSLIPTARCPRTLQPSCGRSAAARRRPIRRVDPWTYADELPPRPWQPIAYLVTARSFSATTTQPERHGTVRFRPRRQKFAPEAIAMWLVAYRGMCHSAR